MGGSYAGNAGVFLVQTLFGLYMGAILLRFLLAVVRADFYNPISQFLVKITNPLLVPLRRVIPSLGRIDMASLVLLLILQILELLATGLISGVSFQPIGLVILAVAELLSLLFQIYFFTILIQVVLSWVSPDGHNPAVSLLYSLNEPVLGRARRILPPIHGFDLSPIVALIVIQLLTILLVAPISDLGRGLAFG
ncbi:MAG TPA: YggT family protein [Gammaproteobacteria bacterium]|nr:YggT family protein [Gammaproteobacteria bacterium]